MGSVAIDRVPLWAVALVGCAIAWLAVEGGFRLGRGRRANSDQDKEGPVGAMVGSILALLAFMLAFTFGLAGSRYDARRQVVLDEANAIGTAYLRAQLLPEPQRDEMQRLLREYTELRIADSRPDLAEAMARSEQVQAALWNQVTKVAEKNPTPITALFVASINEVIDLHSKRVLFGLRSRIPPEIWTGLLLLAVIGLASMGYQAGLSARQRSPAMYALVLAFASVLYLIADLDRPGEGGLRTSQEALIDVQRSMRSGQP